MYHVFGQTSEPYDKVIFDKKTIIDSHTNEDKSKTVAPPKNWTVK
jgi:hypothetical protein